MASSLEPARHTVGAIEIVPILDAVGRLGELGELYPAVPSEHWTPYRALYPQLFDGDVWRLPCACYLVEAESIRILVDTGVGPPGLWDWVPEFEGGLPSRLDEFGVRRDEIDLVFLTHLHIDHLGWNTDERGEVFFPSARYLVPEGALAFARERAALPHIARCVEPLADRFEVLTDETELAPGVTAVPLPGHYPGHMGLRLASDGKRGLLAADAAVHPALLDHPEWSYVSDLDHERCVETRRILLDELVGSDVLVACGHYPGSGVGWIRRRDGRVVWEAA